jgi:hypothetical protein
MQISCDPPGRGGVAGSRRETPAFRRDGGIAAGTVLTVFVTKLQMGAVAGALSADPPRFATA